MPICDDADGQSHGLPAAMPAEACVLLLPASMLAMGTG